MALMAFIAGSLSRDVSPCRLPSTGRLVVEDEELVLRAALDGVGFAFISEHKVASHLAAGSLVRVPGDWCQPFPGFFLFYPSRRQQTASLAAVISALRC